MNKRKYERHSNVIAILVILNVVTPCTAAMRLQQASKQHVLGGNDLIKT